MITIDASHVVYGICPPYPLRPKALKCPVLFSAVEVEQPGRGEQLPEIPATDDILPKDPELPEFGCQGAYPPKREIVSVDFNETVDSGMESVESDPASFMDTLELGVG